VHGSGVYMDTSRRIDRRDDQYSAHRALPADIYPAPPDCCISLSSVESAIVGQH